MTASWWETVKSKYLPRDDAVRNILASAGAGLAGRLLCHPMDTIKAQLQAGSATGTGIARLGVKGLYRGLGVTLVGGVPATAVYLNAYDYTKTFLLEKDSTFSPFAVFFAAGMAAETLSCLVFVPVDVIKERMQVQGLQMGPKGVYYRNAADAVRQIAKSEGLVRGFYKGYNATLLSFGPFSAIYFALYEALKPMAAQRLAPSASADGSPAGETFASNMLASAVAGAVSSWVTNPLDLAKLRLQIARMVDVEVSAEAAGLNMHSTPGMLTYVYRREGVRGLYRGALTRVFYHAPHTAVTIVAFDEFKKLLG